MKFQYFHGADFFGPGRIAGPEAGRGPRCSYAGRDAIQDGRRHGGMEDRRTGGDSDSGPGIVTTATAGPAAARSIYIRMEAGPTTTARA